MSEKRRMLREKNSLNTFKTSHILLNSTTAEFGEVCTQCYLKFIYTESHIQLLLSKHKSESRGLQN